MASQVDSLTRQTRGSAIVKRSARRSVSVEYRPSNCCANNANRTRVNLRNTCTFSNCHVLFGYLHCFVQESFQYRLNHRRESIRCSALHTRNAEVSRTSDKPISTTTNVVDNSASAPLWTRTPVAMGHKFSAVRRLSRRLLDR